MSVRIFPIISLIGIAIIVIGSISLWNCVNGEIGNLAQCRGDLLLTIVGVMFTAVGGGGGAAAS